LLLRSCPVDINQKQITIANISRSGPKNLNKPISGKSATF